MSEEVRLDLSVIVVNWKVAPLVGRLLDSIALETRGLTVEVIVIDNASRDGLATVVRSFQTRNPHLPVELVQNERNLGFAAACNQGLYRARGRHLVLLNPDTRVVDGALQKMIAWLDQHPDVGVAGPRLLNEDGSIQPSVRRLPLLADQLLVMLKLHHLSLRFAPLRRYLHHDFDYSRESDVEQVMGAALFIRRECLEAIGPLDERFFTWFEEVDYCKRACAAGWRVVYAPTAAVIHLGGTSFAQELTARNNLRHLSSSLKYFAKHHGRTAALVLGVAFVIGLVWFVPARLLWKPRRRPL